MEAGVPQGSILSPLLFNIYVHDLPSDRNIVTAQYADDTAFLYRGKNKPHMLKKMQQILDDVHDWTDQWRVSINADKSQSILFSNGRVTNPEENLTFDDEPIQWCNTAKYLGIRMDRRLSWKYHVTDVINKAKGAFMRLSKLLLENNNIFLRRKIQIYKSIIRPKITYGCAVWRTLSPSQMRRLESTQSWMLRRIVGAPYYVRNAVIRNDLRLPSLTETIEKLTSRNEARMDKQALLHDHHDQDDAPRRKRKRPLDL